MEPLLLARIKGVYLPRHTIEGTKFYCDIQCDHMRENLTFFSISNNNNVHNLLNKSAEANSITIQRQRDRNEKDICFLRVQFAR